MSISVNVRIENGELKFRVNETQTNKLYAAQLLLDEISALVPDNADVKAASDTLGFVIEKFGYQI